MNGIACDRVISSYKGCVYFDSLCLGRVIYFKTGVYRAGGNTQLSISRLINIRSGSNQNQTLANFMPRIRTRYDVHYVKSVLFEAG